MRALCLTCTLKRSPEPSNTADLAGHVLADPAGRGFATEMLRGTDVVVDLLDVCEPATPGIHVAMIAKGRNGTQITDRDLRRVMAARRALHAYEPYAPTGRPQTASGTRTRSGTASSPSSRPRSSAR